MKTSDSRWTFSASNQRTKTNKPGTTERKKNEKDLTIHNRFDGFDSLYSAPDSGKD
jgi:hypothetical protein